MNRDPVKKKSETPAIAVVCPCFNHGRYVREMLDSVLAQTFQDFEVIIVDDGSTDETAEILDNIRHEKITVIHTPNRGPAAARNTAIEAARAPIIFNLDADDKIAPSLFAKALAAFAGKPGLGIVTGGAFFFGAKSGSFELPLYSLEAQLRENVIPSFSFFLKTDWEAVGGFSDALIHGLEDYDFWLSIIERGRDVHRIPEDLVFYRTYARPNDSRSGRRKMNRRKVIEARLILFHRHEALYKTYPGEYRRMTDLEKKWAGESPTVRWLKQCCFTLRRIAGGRPR